MNRPHVLISGAGVGGPALAWWLNHWGFTSTVVERAHRLREGGQAVDFRGPIHRAVLERMGIWKAIHERRTPAGELVLLGANGAPRVTIPEVMTAGDVEILRGDLSRLLYERTRDVADYRFGDRVVALEDRGCAVAVEFEHGAPETFDYVVGADGLHSGVRGLAFGDENGFLRHHGYRVASFGMPNILGARRGAVVYGVPSRAVCIAAIAHDQARALLVYADGPLEHDRRDADTQRRAIRKTFAGVGWEVPRVIEALDRATDLYVDAIATVHVDHYANGRIALLGDAAYGGTLGGQGTSLAIVGAYVLAGELAASTQATAAFARYEMRIRPYATRCQKGATRVGSFYAPRTQLGIAVRNAFYAALTSRHMGGWFEWMVKDAASDFALPHYAFSPASAA
jgi:2-polyprenyl-6-methoxyphenol hydroxylase-like FAD-dependent oxidoreductase